MGSRVRSEAITACRVPSRGMLAPPRGLAGISDRTYFAARGQRAGSRSRDRPHYGSGGVDAVPGRQDPACRRSSRARIGARARRERRLRPVPTPSGRPATPRCHAVMPATAPRGRLAPRRARRIRDLIDGARSSSLVHGRGTQAIGSRRSVHGFTRASSGSGRGSTARCIRELHDEHRPGPAVPDLEDAAVAYDDRTRQRQPKAAAGSRRLRREEWLEHAIA